MRFEMPPILLATGQHLFHEWQTRLPGLAKFLKGCECSLIADPFHRAALLDLAARNPSKLGKRRTKSQDEIGVVLPMSLQEMVCHATIGRSAVFRRRLDGAQCKIRRPGKSHREVSIQDAELRNLLIGPELLTIQGNARVGNERRTLPFFLATTSVMEDFRRWGATRVLASLDQAWFRFLD
jgi:hypothetical protein